MNSGENHNKQAIDRIAIADADNYVGRFIEHYLRNAVTDSENLLTVTPDFSPGDNIDLLVWSSLAPTPERAEEISRIFSHRLPKKVVMLSTCAVYGAAEGENINELSPVDSNSPALQAEERLSEICGKSGSVLTILRLPLLIVGTDMDGRLMEIVKQIFRGTYYDISDCNAKNSIVHASEIGPAVLTAAGTPGIFNLNDASDTTVTALTDALSYRIGHKKPFSIKSSNARKLARIADLIGWKSQGTDMLRFKTTTLTFSAEKFMSAFDFKPVTATDYLRNHVYDETSL